MADFRRWRKEKLVQGDPEIHVTLSRLNTRNVVMASGFLKVNQVLHFMPFNQFLYFLSVLSSSRTTAVPTPLTVLLLLFG